MSGGSGTRLWPLSRKSRPKQYHALVTASGMFTETLRRVQGGDVVDVADPTVICAAGHGDLIREQAAESGINLTAIITEPTARNTAAVGAVAASFIKSIDPEGLILLLPADHHILDVRGFWQAISYGLQPASDGYMTTLGIKPAGPETGYGYIKAGADVSEMVYEIEVFKEKPDLDTAKAYVEDGSYFWNAGIFLFSADALEKEYETHASEILRIAKASLDHASRDGLLVNLCLDHFATCPSDSIDYAIMEKADKSAVVAPVEIGWSDVGSWATIADLKKKSATEGALYTGAVIGIDTEDTLVHSTGPMVATLGVKDLIIVATGDAVLVAHIDEAQNIKKIVKELQMRGREDLL